MSIFIKRCEFLPSVTLGFFLWKKHVFDLPKCVKKWRISKSFWLGLLCIGKAAQPIFMTRVPTSARHPPLPFLYGRRRRRDGLANGFFMACSPFLSLSPSLPIPADWNEGEERGFLLLRLRLSVCWGGGEGGRKVSSQMTVGENPPPHGPFRGEGPGTEYFKVSPVAFSFS